MERNKLENFIDFWENIFSSENPLAKIYSMDGEMPQNLSKWFQYDIPVYPEPFYGYFKEDMTKDVLLLLINPGQLQNDVKELKRLNSFTVDRIINWKKEDYLNDTARLEKVNNLAVKWRRTMQNSINNIIGSAKYYHTIELFPYHSKTWKSFNKAEKEWYYNTKSFKLLIDAIIDIANSKKVKYILAKGKDWIEVLEKNNFKLIGEPEIIYKNETGGISHRIYKYRYEGNESSLPIVIHISGGGGMFFPKDQEAVNCIRKFIGIK